MIEYSELSDEELLAQYDAFCDALPAKPSMVDWGPAFAMEYEFERRYGDGNPGLQIARYIARIEELEAEIERLKAQAAEGGEE